MQPQSDGTERVEMVTALGVFILAVDVVSAPVTARNFLRYVESGLIDGTSFYRVVAPCNQSDAATKIDVVQGGLSEDRPPPFFPIEHEPTCRTGLRHRDGTLSMARRDLGSAAGSFFICIGDQPELNYGGKRHPDGQGFAAFGQVVDGMAAVRAIWERAEPNTMLSKPVPILSATIQVSNGPEDRD